MDAEFKAHAVRLDEPPAAAVRDAFAALPRRGCFECVCRWDRRLEVLSALEAAGAFAIHLEPLDGFAAVRVVALKGKSGPCYDTGRRAAYRGEAAAVLDDDSHLLVGEIRVCEKTGGLYSLWPYRGTLSVTEADAVLLARLESDPVPFDCNTFDADSQRLARAVGKERSEDAPEVAVVYPGPFRAVVLKDGSVLRRGVAVRVAVAHAARKGLLLLPPGRSQEALACENYASASRARGAAFILEPLEGLTTCVAAGAAAAAELEGEAVVALRAAPRELKRRLLQLIDAREPYLVLTGSDPALAGGCCPSTQVGAANRLVSARALQPYAPPAPPDACAVTFYAFPGEIVGESGSQPDFRVCETVRQQAAEALRDECGGGWKGAARPAVLALLGVSLGVAAWRTWVRPDGDEGIGGGRASRICAVCEAAAGFSHRVAAGGVAGPAGAVSLGAIAALQPCAWALLAGAVASLWRPGSGVWANVGRGGLLAAGVVFSNAALAVVAAWCLSQALGGESGVVGAVRAFRGPLMILAGVALTGLVRVPVRQAPGLRTRGGLLGAFLLGAALGAIWCPVGVGLFAGVLLPSALQRGAPVRDALLYSLGYGVPVMAFGAVLAAGFGVSRVRMLSRSASVLAGWALILLGGKAAVM